MSVFLSAMAVLIYFTAEPAVAGQEWWAFTTFSFLIGGATSIVSGYIGMKVAVYTNSRTTKECATSIGNGFVVAFRGGQVLGFILVGLALFVLMIIILVYRAWRDPKSLEDFRQLFEVVAGYGLGGSTVALFGRVGGGIYTKAADVGSDLAGKVVEGLDEDDPTNPGVIADNVGDNVGDIAGMGADLFGSLAESTCAALVVSATSPEITNTDGAMFFPLVITAAGIFVSFITSFFATNFMRVNEKNVESILKWQLIISTIIMTGVLIPLCLYVLPETFTFPGAAGQLILTSTPWKAFGCIACGLWSGLVIGYVTEIYTSNTYRPVQELAESCRMGPAPNIILGLALGYMSNVIPIFCLAITIYVSF